jgi:hypothetical protein
LEKQAHKYAHTVENTSGKIPNAKQYYITAIIHIKRVKVIKKLAENCEFIVI